MHPEVSVIMSTLNTNKDYLIQSINSILNQTFTNLELNIVVDGGNDDEIITNNFNDSRIRIIKHNETKGLPYSLNEAIKLSKGKYIARMDSDDFSINSRLAEQVDYMNKHDNIDILATYYQQFGNSNKKIKEKFVKSEDIRCKLFFVNCIAHPSVMFRKTSIYDKTLFYDTNYSYSQDYELWTRYSNVNIAILPKICLLYRVHNNQVSSLKKEKQFQLYQSILNRNLMKLNFSEENIIYLLALNGTRKDIYLTDLYKFVLEAINRNELNKRFDLERFKKILLRQFEIYCIKNKKILNWKFIKNFKYLFIN